MKANTPFPVRHRAMFPNWLRCLAIVLSAPLLADVQAQTQIVWHSFSMGYQRGGGGGLSMAAVVGQPFVGIQGSGTVVVACGFAAYEGFGNVVADVHGEGDFLPATFGLSQNFPNPFNPSTVIRYELPRESRTVITIYSLLGQKVATLVDDMVATGRHSVTWSGRNDDGRPASSGVYFYRMQADDFAQVKTLVLLK